MKVYNTLTGQKEEFLPPGDEVKMYVCGVTPYSDCHLGHAMSYIIFDVIRRYLQFRGYKVKYVQNITDIDDKIIDRANQLGISTSELAGKYTESFHEDMDALNISRADIYPRATEEIPKIIEVIQGLVDKGYAYPAGGSVYFRVKNVPDYGKLSHRSLESMMSAEGALGSDDKESPMDFVLWKAAKPGEPLWESPWGAGRPGWHIECSAMLLKYLGGAIDIHGGGQDLVFPHHENEIAQSESFIGVKPLAKYWLHNGLVQMGGEKMSKSLGNLITIKEAVEKYSSDAIRIFVLSSHYRSPLTYSEETLGAVEGGADRLRQATRREATGEKTDKQVDIETYRKRFIEAMDDDFNTAQALAIMFDLTSEINRLSDEDYSVIRGQQLLLELANILGLTLEPREELLLDVECIAGIYTNVYQELGRVPAYDDKSDAERMVYDLVEVRQELREAKQWLQADMVRAKLEGTGITLEDTPQGTVWRIKR
ncbi:cysteine--tRNA ligase [Chloroflexota bacterium]